MNNDRSEDELLPWLVNGTLTGDEKARVEAWLAANQDSETLRGFDEAVREHVKAEQVGSPGAFGLRRLQKAIARERESATPLTAGPAANDNRWWKPAIAAAALVILVQGGVILDQFNDRGDYQPLGVEQQTGKIVQVEFNPDASNQEVSDLLRSLDLQIIDGPAASGLYRLRIGGSVTTPDETLDRLRQAEGVVRFAEVE